MTKYKKVSRTSYDQSTVKNNNTKSGSTPKPTLTSTSTLTSISTSTTTTTTTTLNIDKFNDDNNNNENGADLKLPSLSSKLNSLSLEERSHGLHDLHGVSDLEIETPQMIQQKLQELNLTLNNMINTTTTTTTSDASSYSSPQSQQQQQQPLQYMFGNDNQNLHIKNNNNSNDNVNNKTSSSSPMSFLLSSFQNINTTNTTNTNTSTNTATIDTTAADINTYAFKHAMNENPNFVDKFKLPCLRTDRFNVSKAAIRMIRFFHRKYQLFGLEKLTKDITMEDLTSDDRHALQSGLVQLLPQKDRSGRTIMILFGKLSPDYSTDTVMRVFFYMSMAAIFQDYNDHYEYNNINNNVFNVDNNKHVDIDKDNNQNKNTTNNNSNNNNTTTTSCNNTCTTTSTSSQRHGVVLIYYGHGQNKVVRGRGMELLKTWWAVPMKIVAGHFCTHKTMMHPAVKLFFFTMESRLLCRFRCHFGTHIECIYDLMTFGIPKQLLPIDISTSTRNNKKNENDGDGAFIQLTMHHRLLAMLKRREDDAKEEETKRAQENSKSTKNQEDQSCSEKAVAVEEDDNDDDGRGEEEMKYQKRNSSVNEDDEEDNFDEDDNYDCADDEDPLENVKFDNSGFPITGKETKKENKNLNSSRAPPPPPPPPATTTTTTTKRATTILIPGPMDLVMGRRGRHAKNAPGALRMRHLLEEYHQQYDASSKVEKTVLATDILVKMKESGCRFLKLTPQGWIECDDLVARNRLAHAFRNLRGKRREEKQNGKKGKNVNIVENNNNNENNNSKIVASMDNTSIDDNNKMNVEKKGEKRHLDVSTTATSPSES